MRQFASTIHHFDTECGTIKIVETPLERVYEDVYPHVYSADANALWRVRYDLFEPDQDASYRQCTLIVPCACGWQSAPPDGTLAMMLSDADEAHCSTPEEMAESSGADFTVEKWREIFAVWAGWGKALGEFFGKYYRDVRYAE